MTPGAKKLMADGPSNKSILGFFAKTTAPSSGTMSSAAEQASETLPEVEQALGGPLDAGRASNVASATEQVTDAPEVKQTSETVSGVPETPADPSAALFELAVAQKVKAKEAFVDARQVMLTRGVSVKLCLRDVLAYMFTVLFCWVYEQYPPKVYEDLATIVSPAFADFVVSCMVAASPAVVKYVETCLSLGQPFDMRRFRALLDKTSPLENGRRRQGVYLVILYKALGFWNVYGGSSAALTNKGLLDRISNHLSPIYRLRETDKVLYRVWDNNVHPDDTELGRPILLLPRGHIGKHGIRLLLAMETVVSLFFGTWSEEGANSLKINLSSMYPQSLVKAFSAYCGKNGGPAMDRFDNNLIVMKKAMGFAASDPSQGFKLLQGTNNTLPLKDSRMYKDVDKIRSKKRKHDWQYIISSLVEGVIRRIQMISLLGPNYNWKFTLGTHQEFFISAADTERMYALGFDPKFPHATITLHLADGYDPENWAQVPENTGTATNPLGYEDAHRILLRLSFETEDGTVQELNLKLSSRVSSPLERACLAMTVFEYAVGKLPLPNDDNFQGRRRLDICAQMSAQGTKAWHRDQPEMADEGRYPCDNCGKLFWNVKELTAHTASDPECSAVKQAAKDKVHAAVAGSVDRYKCIAPGCNATYVRFNRLGQHILGNSEGKGGSAKCRKALGINTLDDLKAMQLQCVIDETLIPAYLLATLKGERAPEKYHCSHCGYQQKLFGYMSRHFGFASKKPSPRQLACREGCGIFVESDITEEKVRNPEWTRKDHVR